jgi:hypothetical protein
MDGDRIETVHWQSRGVMIITYDDGLTSTTIAAESVAERVAAEEGLIVAGATGNGDKLWARPGDGKHPHRP